VITLRRHRTHDDLAARIYGDDGRSPIRPIPFVQVVLSEPVFRRSGPILADVLADRAAAAAPTRHRRDAAVDGAVGPGRPDAVSAGRRRRPDRSEAGVTGPSTGRRTRSKRAGERAPRFSRYRPLWG